MDERDRDRAERQRRIGDRGPGVEKDDASVVQERVEQDTAHEGIGIVMEAERHPGPGGSVDASRESDPGAPGEIGDDRRRRAEGRPGDAQRHRQDDRKIDIECQFDGDRPQCLRGLAKRDGGSKSVHICRRRLKVREAPRPTEGDDDDQHGEDAEDPVDRIIADRLQRSRPPLERSRQGMRQQERRQEEEQHHGELPRIFEDGQRRQKSDVLVMREHHRQGCAAPERGEALVDPMLPRWTGRRR